MEFKYEYAGMVVGELCFDCGRPLSVPFVYWSGIGVDDERTGICLHPQCAKNMAEGLLKDANNINS